MKLVLTEAGVDFELTSTRPFPAVSALVVMTVGARTFTESRYAGNGMTTLVFSVSRASFDALAAGEPVSVHYDPPGDRGTWDFGRLEKTTAK